jgi:MFS family permease
MRAARARQKEEFGGINWGAAFFGWLVAVGLGALLTGILSAAGASLAIGEVSGSDAGTVTLISAIALVAVLMIAYFAGGYVAGRMSRFDGARQGFAAWAVGIIIAIALAIAGAILGAEYNVLSQLNLPRIPIDEGSLKIGGIIALAAAILLPLIASILGGKAGERYHKKVDRVAIDH